MFRATLVLHFDSEYQGLGVDRSGMLLNATTGKQQFFLDTAYFLMDIPMLFSNVVLMEMHFFCACENAQVFKHANSPVPLKQDKNEKKRRFALVLYRQTDNATVSK